MRSVASTSSKRRTGKKTAPLWYVLVGLILLGVFFRFYNLEKKEFWHDETVTVLCLCGPFTGPIPGLFKGTVIHAGDLPQYTRLDPQIGFNDVVKKVIDLTTPVHVPLFSILAFCWTGLVGSGVANLRLLPAILSLLQIWGAFMLSREISGSRLMGGLAAALISLSPVFVLYAQEVREYSLFQGLFTITAALFLRALRKRSSDGDGWFAYTVSVVICLFTSLNTVCLMIAGFIYIGLRWGVRSKPALRFLISSAIVGILFCPWLVLVLHNLKEIAAQTACFSHPVAFVDLARRWLDNCAYVFVDFGTYDELGIQSHVVSKVLMSIVLFIELLAVALLCFRFRRRSILLAILIVVNAAPWMAMDLMFGGVRSDIIRYCVPVTISLVMAVAYLLHERIVRGRLVSRVLFSLAAVFIFSVEIGSDWDMSQATVWTEKQIGHQSLFSMARVINQDKGTGVQLVSDNGDGSNWIQIVALSRYIKPEVRVQVFGDQLALPTLPPGVNHCYLLNISPQLRQLLLKSGRYKISQCQDMDYFEVATVVNSTPTEKPGTQ